VKNISFKTFLRAETGVAAIEMAFIMPFMLLLYFGLVDLTGLISLNRKITSVASATADLVGQNSTTVTKTDINDYLKVVKLIMNPTPDSKVKVVVYNYRYDGTNVNLQWKVENASSVTCTTAPSTAGMNLLMTAGNDLVVAQACMDYTPYVTSFMGETLLGKTVFDVEQIVTLRPRASLQLNCTLTTGGAACPAT
jgi:Flp pilus assembly protein TadG